MSKMSQLHAHLADMESFRDPYPTPPEPRCDVCNGPATDDHPVTRSESAATGETWAHNPCPSGVMVKGNVFAVANGDRYLATGRRDGRGVSLVVAESCPPELRDEFAVPTDGVELRHGPLTLVGE